jgi:septal ring factor EnvC (AmiA/AmiB activator)
MEEQPLTLDHLKQLQQKYILLKQQRVEIEQEKSQLSARVNEQKQAILSVDKQIAE